MIKRIAMLLLTSTVLISSGFNGRCEEEVRTGKGLVSPKEALYYEKIDKKTVRCRLCPRNCTLGVNKWGYCTARKNIDGKLYCMGYASPCAVHVDPIEKKPFSHFYPGTWSFSIASAGCTLRCLFCQNWEIAQAKPTETINYSLAPQDIVTLAARSGSRSIAYTYTEPTNFYEYMIDTAKLAREAGILNVYHSCGYINEKPLKELCKYMNAACIDLKGFSDDFYNRMCGGAMLKVVLSSLKILKEEGVWLEIVNLVIPTNNDDMKMIEMMCKWIKENLGPDVPLSFSRFYPMHHLNNLPPTPVETLHRAREVGLRCGLHYVYVGNVPGDDAEDTYCPVCRKKIVDRTGYAIIQNNIRDNKCKFCGEKIAGVWGK